MSARIEPNQLGVTRSLVTALAIAFVLLSVIPLLLVSGLLGYFDFQSQREALLYRQQLIAADAAREVSGFVEQIFSALEASAQVGQVADREQQRLILEKLLGFEDALRELVLVDKDGQEITRVSRRSLLAPSILTKLAKNDLLTQMSQGQRFISPVYIDQATSEPLISMAVPVKNVFGEFQGALVAEVNLKFMWDVVDRLKVGETGTAYVVNKQGNLIAFHERDRVLVGENVSQLSEVAEFTGNADADEFELYTVGIKDPYVVAVYVPLGTPDWAVVTEIPVSEAYESAGFHALILLISFLVIAILAAGIGIYASRYLTTPLLNLTQTTDRLAAGEIGLQAALEGPTEVVRLASAFNHMTDQLQELIGSLEEQVAKRTRRLEIIALLSERLNAILDLQQLLQELVSQVKDKFGYYHVQVYLVDDTRQNLVTIAGVGAIGAQINLKEHIISLNTPTSLVAHAARTGQVVKVDNTRESADWQSDLLLPDTYAEMAVPIVLEGGVVGVLDVQENEITGLDEGDANVLRSLTNQVAVAIRNARKFTEAETALAEARAAQERYLEQAWQKDQIASLDSQYWYKGANAGNGGNEQHQIVVRAHQEALATNHPRIISMGDNGSERKTVVAPVNLQGKTIGGIQLHAASSNTWTEDDLRVIEVILEQLGQKAENLRLFEKTRERAGREQTIREITEKMRAAPTLEALVKTAAEELGRRFSAQFTLVELGFESDKPAQVSSEINGGSHE